MAPAPATIPLSPARRHAQETHAQAQRKVEQMDKLRGAFGLRPDINEGDSFNRELQEQRRLDKVAEREKAAADRRKRHEQAEKERKKAAKAADKAKAKAAKDAKKAAKAEEKEKKVGGGGARGGEVGGWG